MAAVNLETRCEDQEEEKLGIVSPEFWRAVYTASESGDNDFGSFIVASRAGAGWRPQMSWACQRINFEDLKPAKSAEEYALHIAAIEWSLAEPIIIASIEDIKSREKWRADFHPYHHQVKNLFNFCARLPVTLLADDVGLGKTISAGLILTELMARRRVARALVIAPALLGPQWVEELRNKFQIVAVYAKGQALDGFITNLGLPVVVTTYHSASKRLEELEEGQFDMLILDEAHKLRNLHGTAKPPIMAQAIKAALENRIFKFVLMLTATPIQNRVWDLYSLIDLLTVAKGHRNPLGSPDEFRRRYIADTGGRKLNEYTAGEFRIILAEYMRRTRREDVKLKFPARLVETRKLPGSEVEQRMETLAAEHIAGLDYLAQISLAQALMSSPQAFAKQLEKMAEKHLVFRAVAEEAESIAEVFGASTAKLRGVQMLIHELRQQRPQDWRLIIFTLRKATQDAIGKMLSNDEVKFGFIRGGAGGANQITVERFQSEPPLINVIVSTDAGAEGVNLQSGNVLVNYDLPWNPMVMEQRIGRIQRLGSEHEVVEIINLTIAGSVEQTVVTRLMEKLQVISQTVGDIEAVLGVIGKDDDESFEEMIRKFVVESLRRQNKVEATKLELESIEAAQRQLEADHLAMNEVFGPTGTDFEQGPRPPKLEQFNPSMSADSFVVKAFAAENATLHPRADDTIDVARLGKPVERITFKPTVLEQQSPGHFGGNIPKLYLPGQPPFEQLVGKWANPPRHNIRSFSANVEALSLLAAKTWCDTVPDARFENFKVKKTAYHFAGSVVCRAKAFNGVDSIERVISVPTPPCNHGVIDTAVLRGAAICREEVSPQTVWPEVTKVLQQAVKEDKAVAGFCDFYEARCREEVGYAGNDARRHQKVVGDFSPEVFAEVVGIDGVRYDVVLLSVAFVLDQKHRYTMDIEVVPASKMILTQPERSECCLTERSLPLPCLAQCAISRKMATAHLLVQSQDSGRMALPEYAVTCGVTGKTLFTDEVLTSGVSGTTAAARLFRRSCVSGRQGLAPEFVKCEMTGDEVLSDELLTSEISGKKFRSDQIAECVVSKKIGHESEFIKCKVSGDLILPQEAAASEVSGKMVKRCLLVASEKKPHRLALPSEMVRCEVTGRRLVCDEVGTSGVSGKRVDKELLAASEISGRAALPDELIHCEESGKLVLPDETSVCAITGRRVVVELLRRSAISDALALPAHMEKCAVTGKLALPSELRACDLTKLRVDPAQLRRSDLSDALALPAHMEKCAVTGKLALPSELQACELTAKRVDPAELGSCYISHKRVLRSLLVTSDITGATVLREHSVKSPVSQRICTIQEAAICTWLNSKLLPDEVTTCKLTGLPFAKHLINTTNEFTILRNMLDGSCGFADGISDAADAVSWLLKNKQQELPHLKTAKCVFSPDGSVRVVCAEMRSMLGFKIRYGGLLLQERGTRDVLGRIVVGRRERLGWTQEI